MPNPEISAASHVVTTGETVFGSLAAFHSKVDVYVDTDANPLIIGTIWRVYAISGAVKTFLAEGAVTEGDGQGQRVLRGVSGAGASGFELRALTRGKATGSAVNAIIVGYDPGQGPSPTTAQSSATHPVVTANTTF